jgi:glycosyltransferase involved in cell wall biosynthesis
MPTYLGPTNIPPLEALAYCVPVCYSDTPTFREQVGDAAFFMDLNNPQSLVNHLIAIMNGDDEVGEKKIKGQQIPADWNEQDFYGKLISIFNKYKYIRELWE